mgnify:CR=1 FL=1
MIPRIWEEFLLEQEKNLAVRESALIQVERSIGIFGVLLFNKNGFLLSGSPICIVFQIVIVLQQFVVVPFFRGLGQNGVELAFKNEEKVKLRVIFLEMDMK